MKEIQVNLSDCVGWLMRDARSGERWVNVHTADGGRYLQVVGVPPLYWSSAQDAIEYVQSQFPGLHVFGERESATCFSLYERLREGRR